MNFKNEEIAEMVRNGNKDGNHEPYLKWPKNVFSSGDTVRITAFIKERFQQTTDKFEYYCCIPFLIGIVPCEKLDVLWEDSPNRMRILA
jgi:hypothetical protein